LSPLLLATLLWPRPARGDVVVHVDADDAGEHLGDPWILRFGLRTEPFRRGQRPEVCTDHSCQKFSPCLTPSHRSYPRYEREPREAGRYSIVTACPLAPLGSTEATTSLSMGPQGPLFDVVAPTTGYDPVPPDSRGADT
jgi:hypothetical protein